MLLMNEGFPKTVNFRGRWQSLFRICPWISLFCGEKVSWNNIIIEFLKIWRRVNKFNGFLRNWEDIGVNMSVLWGKGDVCGDKNLLKMPSSLKSPQWHQEMSKMSMRMLEKWFLKHKTRFFTFFSSLKLPWQLLNVSQANSLLILTFSAASAHDSSLIF